MLCTHQKPMISWLYKHLPNRNNVTPSIDCRHRSKERQSDVRRLGDFGRFRPVSAALPFRPPYDRFGRHMTVSAAEVPFRPPDDRFGRQSTVSAAWSISAAGAKSQPFASRGLTHDSPSALTLTLMLLKFSKWSVGLGLRMSGAQHRTSPVFDIGIFRFNISGKKILIT